MAEEESFIVKLVDEITGPARAAKASLEGLESSAVKMARSGKDAGSSFMGVGAGLGGMVTVAKAALDTLGEVASGFVKLGSGAIGISAYKQQTEDALGILLRSKQAGADTFAEIQKIASTTPFETVNVADAFKMLRGAGYEAKEATAVWKGIGDVAAFKDFSPEVLKNMSLVMAKIKAKGKLDMHDLNSLMIDSGGVIQKDALAKALGMTPQALEHAHLTSKQATDGILKVITDSISGGKAGGLMDAAGKSITGQMSNLKDVPFSLVPAVDKSAGMTAFKTFLGDLVSVLSAGTEGEVNPVFERLKTLVESVIDGIGGLFAKMDKSSIEAAVGTVLDIFEGVRDVIKAVWPYIESFGGGLFDGLKSSLAPMVDMMKAFMAGMGGGPDGAAIAGFRMLGQALGYVVGALAWLELAFRTLIIGPIVFLIRIIGDLIGWVADLGKWFSNLDFSGVSQFIEGIADIFNDLVSQAFDWGANLISGFWEGIKSTADAAWSWTKDKFSSLSSSVKGVFDINSPSGVFKGYGENLTAGLKEGVADSGDLDAVSKMFGDVGGDMSATGSAGGVGGVTNVYNITMHVNAGGKDGASIGKSAGAAFISELRGMERGAA